MRVTQGSATGYACRFPKRIGGSAEFTRQAAHPVRKLVRGAGTCCGASNDLPHVFTELQTFDILSQVIQAADQAKRIAKHRESRLPDTGCYSEPGLLSKLDHNPVGYLLNGDREGCFSAGSRARMRPNLDSHFITFAKNLGVHIPMVEFG